MTSPVLLTPCRADDASGLERTRYYPRQLVNADDLTQDQHYVRERLRRHNRLLHGWGVVCGACVRRGQGLCEVVVQPGVILGPWGNEIVIDHEVTLDLCRQGAAEQLGCCPETTDPWCSDPRPQCEQGHLYLAVRYHECAARPVRAPGDCECGCEGLDCEYSRLRDSFALKLLTELPAGYATPMPQPQIPFFCNPQGEECPSCTADPWVVLADIDVGADCQVRAVDCYRHRRKVLSFAEFYLLCRPTQGGVAKYPVGEMGVVNRARSMAFLTGTPDLVDMTLEAPEQPLASVRLDRPDGSTFSVPAYFKVEAGEKIGEILAREGERRLYDPVTDDTFTLRELYTMAGVKDDLVVNSTAAALAPLEGKVLDLAEASRPETRLRAVLDKGALKRMDDELGGAVIRAGELPVTGLKELGTGSTLGKALADASIADVGGRTRESFLADVLKGAPAKRRDELAKQAERVWTAARRVLETISERR